MVKIWPFCEAFYGQKPVEALCLQLQQQQQVNVGLVIWLCWHAVHKRFVTEKMFDVARTLIVPIHEELIVPIRTLRKSSLLAQQGDVQNIAKALLAAEILLEKEALELLASNTAKLTTLKAEQSTFGLQDYLASQKVQNAQDAPHFLYASALAIISKLSSHNYSR